MSSPMRLLLLSLSVLLPFFIHAERTQTSSHPEVRTRSGTYRGVREVANSNLAYYSFKGIRYAKPPLGELRFKSPEPVERAEGVIDATEDAHVCPQHDISRNVVIGDEDCLALNIYTTELKGTKPVIVYLHGGGFIMGGAGSYMFGPKYLLEQGVVLVTVQYRLGPFGFLSDGSQKTKGNWALQDVLLSLKWIQGNIAKFGGDAKSVTLMGEDSGAAMATLLLLAPKVEGLFHRIIALSGNALCDQYLQRDPREAMLQLATKFDCQEGDSYDWRECLGKQTIQKIVNKANDLYLFFSFPRWFAPVIDKELIPGEPLELFRKGAFYKVPVLVGHTKDEAAFIYRLTLNALANGFYEDGFLSQKLPKLLPIISSIQSKLTPVTKALRKRYFLNVDLEQEDQFRPQYVQMLTDLMYGKCTDMFSQVLAANLVPVYRYQFDYRGQYSIVNLQGEEVDFGVAHGDDLQYVFNDVWGDELPMSKSDTQFSKRVFVPLLVNFAKTSLPTPALSEYINVAWPPTTSERSQILRINSNLTVASDLRKDIFKFWNEDIPALISSAKKSTPIKTEL